MNPNAALSVQPAILELTVNNHPGVTAHMYGLFSCRAFNVDGILCIPLPNSDASRIWLPVHEAESLLQVESQLHKLYDVHEVRRHPPEHEVFGSLEVLFQQ